MKSDRMLELRVLTGIHAGARALLTADSQVIGSGEECALILSDGGVLAQHARLESSADGSVVLRWLDDALPPVWLQPGQSACIGPVRIAIETLGAPWREDLPWRPRRCPLRQPRTNSRRRPRLDGATRALGNGWRVPWW